MKSSLSVIIPTYNEEYIIAKTLQSVLDFSREQGYDTEIIVSDDGSSDQTKERVMPFLSEQVFFLHHHNTGKGGALKRGVALAKKEWVLLMDADSSTPFSEVTSFLDETDHLDMMIGSRELDGSIRKRKEWIHRKCIGRIFNFFVRVATGLPYRDTQCGFKLIRTDRAKELFEKIEETGFAFDVELLVRARKKEFVVKEIGVNWYRSEKSSVSIFRDAFRMFRSVIRIARKV